MHRYSNIDFILNLDIKTGIRLINKAFEEHEKEKVFNLYVSIYPYMSEENFVSFDSFYNTMRSNSNSKTKDEILNEVDILLNISWEGV